MTGKKNKICRERIFCIIIIERVHEENQVWLRNVLNERFSSVSQVDWMRRGWVIKCDCDWMKILVSWLCAVCFYLLVKRSTDRILSFGISDFEKCNRSSHIYKWLCLFIGWLTGCFDKRYKELIVYLYKTRFINLFVMDRQQKIKHSTLYIGRVVVLFCLCSLKWNERNYFRVFLKN